MIDNKNAIVLTPTHHAMLFGWICREVVQRIGEQQAEPVLREAVKQYGNQRGHRMALRAKADGRELNMLNYLVYGEWKAPEGEMSMDNIAAVPHLRTHVKKCSWSTAWRESGLTEFARYYCLEVDEALVYGYNPDLKLDIFQTMTNGAEYCDFSFNEANLTPENAQIMGERIKELDGSTVMPWEYHTAHLLKTIGDFIVEKMGEKGKEAVDAAVKIFVSTYGTDVYELVEQQLGQDFNQLPD